MHILENKLRYDKDDGFLKHRKNKISRPIRCTIARVSFSPSILSRTPLNETISRRSRPI